MSVESPLPRDDDRELVATLVEKLEMRAGERPYPKEITIGVTSTGQTFWTTGAVDNGSVVARYRWIA